MPAVCAVYTGFLAAFLGVSVLKPLTSDPLWGLARPQLGESFSIRAQAKALVTQGLYSRIRNLIYLFGSLMIAGVFVYFGNPYLFVLFLILIPLQVIRLKKKIEPILPLTSKRA